MKYEERLSGDVTIYCGDCAELLEQDEFTNFCDLVLTDPLYDWNESKKRKYQLLLEKSTPNQVIVFCPPENIWHAVDKTPTQHLFWVKPISTKNTSKNYSRFVEEIKVYGEGVWNSDRHWSQYTNVFTDLVDDKDHPYAKPLSLLIRLIRNHSKKGDIIFDPFMGSGTTGIACLQTGRKFAGSESDGLTYILAKERLQQEIERLKK